MNRHVYVFCATIATMLFRIEWLPTLIEMTSLGEGGCDLASRCVSSHGLLFVFARCAVAANRMALVMRAGGTCRCPISSSAVIVSDILWVLRSLPVLTDRTAAVCSSSGQAKIAQRVGVSPRQV